MKEKKKDQILKVGFLGKTELGMRSKLTLVLLLVKIIPIVLITVIAFQQIVILGDTLRNIAISDSSEALNAGARENIERMTTDAAQKVADFLYGRDDDILYAAELNPATEDYAKFVNTQTGRILKADEWVLSEDGASWVRRSEPERITDGGVSTNDENTDGFNYRYPEYFEYYNIPLYDEMTFIDTNGNELVKAVSTDSAKVNYPMSQTLKDVSVRENTYVKAETYFPELLKLRAGEIFVSDVIGAYVGSNYIGMYTPSVVEAAANTRGYGIPYSPEAQAYAGMENPNGQRFEGIVRWATPVTNDGGDIIGYVTLALNHDHIMELVDHLTPMNERYTELPNAYEGNYAFIWDYKCRSICHPRHHSIVGFNPETGNPEIPWLETSVYNDWQAGETQEWFDYIKDKPIFNNQSRSNVPAAALTKQGLVGLDGRYLNNAPQCTGWMDLTEKGGSGSFFILWSGLEKLTTAAAIPYYTGQYQPSEANNYSRRGFGFVTIGAGLDDFTRPAHETQIKLEAASDDNLSSSFLKLVLTTASILVLVAIIAIVIASSISGSINGLINGVMRFRSGQRQFRFKTERCDEFGILADSFDDMADSIVDSVKNPLCIMDTDCKIIYMNDYGLDICKMTLSKIVGTNYGDSSVYPTKTRYCPITALEEGRVADILYLEDNDRYVRGNANYLLSKSGERKGYIVETIDVTDMVRRQIKIEEQNALLDKIFAASPDLIWYKNAKGEYLTVNPRFASIAGISAAEFAGKRGEDILPRETAKEIIERDNEALSNPMPLYTDERIRFADNHEEILESVRTPIIDPNGTIVGMLGFARNITERVKIEKELRKMQSDLKDAVAAANRANEHKGEFLARMSHEIRTPMNAIIGLTNIVHKRLDNLKIEKRETSDIMGNINQIEASSQHLLGLLNDILDISKIEAGKIELADETVEMPKLINTVVGLIRPRCKEKNITFKIVSDTFEPSNFICDSLRLRQVLINLLGNAVKFTHECGVIEFSVRQKERADGKSLIEFSVRDTGIGISEQALEAIFRPFEQGDNKIPRQYGGTGLGLAISRRIVQLFGGDISVASELGEGSTFSFEIWLRETDAVISAEEEFSDAEGRFAGKKVLLVDDVEINRIIVNSILENTGTIIEEANDGIVAVEMFEKSAENYYDIVLMDIKMPNMDGYQAAKAIRALNRSDAQSVPIIALTANAFKDDIDEALRCGMNAHISKPVEVNTLLHIFNMFLNG